MSYHVDMATAAEINTIESSYRSAVSSEDWSAALLLLYQLQSAVGAKPDADSRGESLRWKYDWIDRAIARVEAKIAAGTTSSGAIQRTQVTYTAADAAGGF